MKRVVITGAGIVSCLGNDLTTVKQALMDSNHKSLAVSTLTA